MTCEYTLEEAEARIGEWAEIGYHHYSLWRPGQPGHQSTLMRRHYETEAEAVARWEIQWTRKAA